MKEMNHSQSDLVDIEYTPFANEEIDDVLKLGTFLVRGRQKANSDEFLRGI